MSYPGDLGRDVFAPKRFPEQNARADVELPVHLAKVVLHGRSANEELLPYLSVR